MLYIVLPGGFTLSSILNDISGFTKDLKIQELTIGRDQFSVKMMQDKLEIMKIKVKDNMNREDISQDINELLNISNEISNESLYGNYSMGFISINKNEVKDIFDYKTVEVLKSYTLKKDITLRETNGYQSLVNPNTYIIKASKTIFIKSIYYNVDRLSLVVSW
ncbi:MAG: hypothetical protein KAJ49_06450 [Arcobacteraceae bacterium]|nr:hypothetical protein [Arcobacteraceae bacterium]